MAIGTATFSIRDGKGKTGSTQMYLDFPDIISEERESPFEFCSDMALLIDALIGGAIVNISFTGNVPLPVGLKSTPDVNSDTEERGVFKWECGQPEFTVLQAIPTFLESLVIPGTNRVDLEDSDVNAFVDMMTNPIDLPADWLVQPVDNRGTDITRLAGAYERFRRSRG